jgi:hypothetical protein
LSRIPEMGSHVEGIGRVHLSCTLAVPLEEASQVSGEGIQTELVSLMLTETNLEDRNS